MIYIVCGHGVSLKQPTSIHTDKDKAIEACKNLITTYDTDGYHDLVVIEYKESKEYDLEKETPEEVYSITGQERILAMRKKKGD